MAEHNKAAGTQWCRQQGSEFNQLLFQPLEALYIVKEGVDGDSHMDGLEAQAASGPPRVVWSHRPELTSVNHEPLMAYFQVTLKVSVKTRGRAAAPQVLPVPDPSDPPSCNIRRQHAAQLSSPVKQVRHQEAS